MTLKSQSCPNQPRPNQNNASGSLALIPEICSQFQCEHCERRWNEFSLEIKSKTQAHYIEAKKEDFFFSVLQINVTVAECSSLNSDAVKWNGNSFGIILISQHDKVSPKFSATVAVVRNRWDVDDSV